MKTEKEQEEEVQKLKAMKPMVLKKSMFGDDHHAAIDAQVEVLLGQSEEEDFDDDDDNVRGAVSDVIEWIEDDNDLVEAPSESWKELVR